MDSTLHRVLRGSLLSLFLLVPLALIPWAFHGGQVKHVLFVGCVALAALGWLWIAIVDDHHQIRLSLTNGVLAFNVLIWIISLAFSPHINQGLPVISVRVAGLGFLLLLPVLLATKDRLKLALALLLAATAVMAIYGLIQFFRLDPFPPPAGRVGHFRVFSTSLHPNIFITFLVAAVPLNIAAFRLFERSTRNRILLGVTLVLSLCAAGATLSRAGWVAMVVAVVATLVGIRLGAHKARTASQEAGARRSPMVFIIPVLLALVVMGGLVFALSRGMLDPGERQRMLTLRGGTVQKRALIYGAALKMAAEAPLLGKGLGTFSLYLPAYRGPELARQFPRNEYYSEAAVSEPLEVLVESGAVGLLGWLLLVGLFLVRPLRALARVEDSGLRALMAAGAAAMLGMVTHGLVEVSLRFLPPLFMFWAVPGLAWAAERAAGADAGAGGRRLDLTSWPQRLGLSVVVGMTFGLVFAVTLSDFVANIHVEFGMRALRRGEVKVAQRSFSAAEAAWSGNLEARYRRAYTLWKLGHLDRAEKEYREVIRQSPYYFDVNHNLARVLYERGKLAQAATWTARATRLNPHHIPSHELAVRLALQGGRLGEADRIARHMLEAAGDYRKKPNTKRFVWSRVATARVRRAQGRQAEAVKLLDDALAADPGNKEARHLRRAVGPGKP